MKTTQLFLIAVLAILQTPLVADAAGDAVELSIVGAGGNGMRLIESRKSEIEKALNVKIVLRTYAADLAIANLARGKVDAFVGPEIKGMFEQLAKDGKIPQQKLEDYNSAPVTVNVMSIGFNSGRVKAAPPREQMKEILSGSMKTWKKLNGSNDPMIVMLAIDKPRIRETLEKIYLDGAKSQTDLVKDYGGQLRGLKKHPGGVIFSSETVPDTDGFQPEFFPTEASQTTSIYAKKNGSPQALKLISYLNEKK